MTNFTFYSSLTEWLHNHQGNLGDMCLTVQTRHTFRSGSLKNVPDERIVSTITSVITDKYRNRDSGTSSPQPNEHRTSFTICTSPIETAAPLANSNEDDPKVPPAEGKTKVSLNVEYFASRKKEKIILDEEFSDSNDSVFSSASSVDSILNCGTQESFDSECNGLDWDLRDIYLGGSCMLRTTWRKQVVIPILEANNITYHLPQLHESIYHDKNGISNSSEAKTLPTPLALLTGKKNKKSMGVYRHPDDGNASGTQATALSGRKSMYNPTILESSRILLFVITNETRSLAPMTLAAHCIGLGFDVVLCIQMLTDDCVIGEDKVINLNHHFVISIVSPSYFDISFLNILQLTPTAIKDYNRGRSYLIDLAKRQDVPVFDNIKGAVNCAIEKVKMSKSRTTV